MADRNGFAVVYPEAIDHWNDGRDATAGFGDDTRFTSELINELVKRDGIDRSRVYATGASNGGLMTLRVACERANEIAAFVAVAASFPDTYMSRCKPTRPVPIMIIHGSQDPLIPEQGAKIQGGTRRLGGTVTPLKDTVDFWRRADRCQAPPSPKTLPDSSNDGTTVQVSDYQGCAPNSRLVFVNVVGGGHTWPDERIATNPKAGRVTHDIDGTQYVWDFFKNYSLSGQR
jgi:polyhydroxybutyrate depolymerase